MTLMTEKFYDIFNGDADGICALHQLRLDEPQPALLLTGVKRDTRLLERVPVEKGIRMTVLDISMKSNMAALRRLLGGGAHCRYFDHHAPGEPFEHVNLERHIDTAPDLCTSLIVDRHLEGRQRLWAVVGAFGDNMVHSAVRIAQPLALEHNELARLHELGDCINYNAYGDTVDDLHYPPADLYAAISPYRDPRQFIYDEPIFDVLREAYADDLSRVEGLLPEAETPTTAAYVLPDAGWSRRVQGIFGNRLAQKYPARAHAILVQTGSDAYKVSVRAALQRPHDADTLCFAFETGGGRKSAAGINRLPAADLPRFVVEFQKICG